MSFAASPGAVGDAGPGGRSFGLSAGRENGVLRARRRALLVAAVLLTACTGVTSVRHRYDHERAEPPFTIHWTYVRGDTATLVLEGLARNHLPGKFEVVDVYAHVAGRDAAGRVVSRATVRVPDLAGSETAFRAVLALAGPEQSFEFRLEYALHDIEANGGRD